MRLGRDTGQNRPSISRFRNALASSAIAAVIAVGAWAGFGASAISSGETRTISLHHIHTGEDLTVTYMVNGRYVPSAMKQINYLLRDWRQNEVITIDPKTIDLVWELHADLGSQVPVNVVCGYRSAKTNGFLKRIGRNVAKTSQHIQGKAIDIFFPDVPTVKMRNSALVREIGGVGYYRGSGGPTGFLHVDSGRVRHWGPGIGAREMAVIFRDYRKTVGARLTHQDQILLAEASSNAPSQQVTNTKLPVEAAYEGDDEELADMAQEASEMPDAPRSKLADMTVAEAIVADPIPKPRPKPIEVLMMAAVNMKIEPASAPPPLTVKLNSPVSDSIGAVEAPETMAELTLFDPISNIAGKGDLAGALRDGTASGVPVIRTIAASAAGADLFWWPRQIIFNGDQAVRRDGAPRPFADTVAGILPGSAEAAETPRLTAADVPESASGKGDMLSVNRQGKGNLPAEMTLSRAMRQTVGLLENQ